jgi:hypothetical protein
MIVFDGKESGGGGGGNPPDPNSEVAKAYEKLRQAESERDRLKAENRTLKQNADQNTVEELQKRVQTLESERDTAVKERDEARGEFGQFKTRIDVEKAARDAGFRSPGVAVDLLMFRKADLTDQGKITKALTDLAQEDPGMVTSAPPSGGPVNPQNGDKNNSGGSGFNQAIRAAAGRPTA